MALSTDRIVQELRPALDVLHPADSIRRAQRVERIVGNDGKLIPRQVWSGVWNGNDPILTDNGYHLWIDGSGRLRIKNGKATSDTDGVVVGTQT